MPPIYMHDIWSSMVSFFLEIKWTFNITLFSCNHNWLVVSIMVFFHFSHRMSFFIRGWDCYIITMDGFDFWWCLATGEAWIPGWRDISTFCGKEWRKAIPFGALTWQWEIVHLFMMFLYFSIPSGYYVRSYGELSFWIRHKSAPNVPCPMA